MTCRFARQDGLRSTFNCTCYGLACQIRKDVMQGTQLHRELPAYLSQETDTATPRTPIPIYYFHPGAQPFCDNPHCFCQRGKLAAAHLFPLLSTGSITVAQVNVQTASVTVTLDTNDPCELYGHSWQITEHPNIKECTVCHLFGYCPGCTPIAPMRSAQPFYCSYHTGEGK